MISLDAGLRMDGIPVPLVISGTWLLKCSILLPTNSQNPKREYLLRDTPSSKHTNTQIKIQIQHKDLELSKDDFVSSNANSFQSGAMLCIFLCIFGSHTFVPTSWMCKKQTSVSHSSTESEIISVDAGLRRDGIPALDLWDLVIEVFHSSSNQFKKPKERVQGD